MWKPCARSTPISASSSSVSWSATNSAIGAPSGGARERDDRLDDLAVDRVAGEPAHELAVDLEVVDRERAQRGEGAEAGAEVVERDPEAEPRQRLGERARLADVRDRGGLLDLDDQHRRVDAARGQLVLEQLDDAGPDRARRRG